MRLSCRRVVSFFIENNFDSQYCGYRNENFILFEGRNVSIYSSIYSCLMQRDRLILRCTMINYDVQQRVYFTFMAK